MEHGDQHSRMRVGRWLAGRATIAATVAILIGACGDNDLRTAAVTSTTIDAVPPTTTSSTSPLPALDGHLLFSRFDESTHTFLSTHVAAADGSGEVELVLPGPEGGGRWSHAGNEFAVMTILGDQRIGTAVVTAEGDVERILSIADPTLNLACVVWSPDDSRLACEGWDDTDPSRSGIYAVNSADGTELIRLTTAPEGEFDLPGDFNADGSSLLFKRGPDEQNGHLFLTDTESASDPRPFGTDVFEDPGRFSPDGQLIASSVDGRLVILGADGAMRDTIEDEGRFLFGPSWSPTGEWLAYSGDSGGFHADIYVSHPDGSEERQVTHTPDNEIVVEWGAG